MSRLFLLFLFSALVWAQTFPFVGPVLQNLGQNEATIWWLDNNSGQAKLIIQELPSNQSATVQTKISVKKIPFYDTELYRYEIIVNDLKTNTRYKYSICVGALCSPEYQFQTAPDENGPFSFIVFGDNGSGPYNMVKWISDIMAKRAGKVSAVCHVGDRTNDTALVEDTLFYQQNRILLAQASFCPTLGNHDNMRILERDWMLSLLSLPTAGVPYEGQKRYYSFDFGPAHFVVLDTTEWFWLQPGSPMLLWLENDLATTKKTWKIVFFHHPPFLSAGSFHEFDDNCTATRENVAPILEKYGVQVVFSGHQHGYQRTFSLKNEKIVLRGFGTRYITTAGGGSDLYPAFLGPLQAENISDYNFAEVNISGEILTEWVGLEKTIDTFEIKVGHTEKIIRR